ncbi:probable protein phosphatase 2C 33 [Chenopodium quinoa]|uniref:protein-serine/threonine phosphatase n=1 Tax=Chenopodium quinoa TaxID=63459 RepID=A0A803L458_CHEQI|nr:probable protein phosphatase 2C 33 [Chenopodium quinoa]
MGSCLSAESRSPLPGSPSAGLGVRRKKNAKKRFGSRGNSFDHRKDEYLYKIPGRLFFNGSTEVASLFTQQGKKGTNQDAMIVWENFCSRNDTIFCGVFDGHGPYGHMVARKVRDSLPQKLHAQWEVNAKSEEVLREISLNSSSMNSEDTSFISADEDSRVSVDLEETEKDPEIYQILKESFLKAFRIMDRELRVHTSVDCFCSGTTAVTFIKQGQDLVIGNVGDSRAVLGTRDDDNTLVAVQLTVDLKPNLPAEAERIKKCRGRVFALQDEPDVARVWLPNNDSPGLAMARAFGDFCLKDFGLIAVPDISYRRLTEKDEFIVLATDGIWDVLSNKEVVDIVAGAPSRSTAARALVETAVRGWKMRYPTSKTDDCAVVCLFLDSNTDNISSAFASKEKDHPISAEPAEAGADKEHADGPTTVDQQTIKVDEKVATEDDMLLDDYSALDGVTRVNTLLNLPRFTPRKVG